MSERPKGSRLGLIIAASLLAGYPKPVSVTEPEVVAEYDMVPDFAIPIMKYAPTYFLIQGEFREEEGMLRQIKSLGIACGYDIGENSFLADAVYFVDLNDLPFGCDKTEMSLFYSPFNISCLEWMREQTRLACGDNAKLYLDF